MAATAKAFLIFEILEDILLYLPSRQVLLVTRVSRFWQATINGSIPIRRLLFFEPLKSETKEPGSSVGSRILNPYVNFDVRTTYAGIACSREKMLAGPSSAEGSWRRMLITQPPCNTVSLTQLTLGKETIRWILEHPTPVTWGQVVDASSKMLWLYDMPPQDDCNIYSGDEKIRRLRLGKGQALREVLDCEQVDL